MKRLLCFLGVLSALFFNAKASEIIGEDYILLPVSMDDASVDYDLTKVATAFGLESVDALFDGYYVKGLKADGTYTGGLDAINSGIIFNISGGADEYGDIGVGFSEDYKQIWTYSNVRLATPFKANATLCFEINNKRYVIHISLVDPQSYFVWGTAKWNTADDVVYNNIDEFKAAGLALVFPNPADCELTSQHLIFVQYDIFVDDASEPIKASSGTQAGASVMINYRFPEGHTYRVVTTKALLAQANLSTYTTDTLSINNDSYSITFTINGPELQKTIDVEAYMSLAITNQEYTKTVSKVDVADICATLDISDISDAVMHPLSPNGSYCDHMDIFDWWRDADGEFTNYNGGWNSIFGCTASPPVYCIKMNAAAGSLTYYFYDYWTEYVPESEDEDILSHNTKTSYNSVLWDWTNEDGTVTRYKRSYRVEENKDYQSRVMFVANGKSVVVCATMHFVPINAQLMVVLPPSQVQYDDVYIELTDNKDDVLFKYVVTNGLHYTFSNLVCNRVYNVYIKNKSGYVLGAIQNVTISEDTTISFDSLLQPQNLKVGIYTPDGTDVTESAIVTWVDVNNNYLSKGAALSGQVENTEVKYSVKLSKELAMQYKQPEQATYMVKPSGNEIKVVLEPFASVEVMGIVRDSVTGIPVRDAMVTFSQKLNGEYAHITRAETDGKGAFKATLYDVPAEVMVAAADYISYTMSLDTLTEATALGDILMKPISGVVVSVGFTYRTSVPDGDTPEILGWYTDYDNVKYGILNKTTGLPVSNFSVQYPQLVLLDGVSVGDELLLTVVSRTGSFEPTQTTVVVDSALQCDATFDIVELGGIEASYTSTTNSAVVGILYNEIGEMVQKRSYSSGSLTLDNLRDGSYTLVTMGSSDYFNAIYNMAQLSAVGLVEGTDYVKHAVKVESGVVSVVEMESVPAFDESKLYYTGGDTRFTVNKTSATAGNYLTLTGKIDFKEEYASKVSGVSMVIDLPESAVFVDNSVMVGAINTGGYSYILEGNRLTISLSNNYTERVRFCIIPTEGGSYSPTAFAQFTIDDKEVLQPIGSAHYTIKDLSIEVPSISAKTTIPVSGTAIGQSTIQIYDNDVLIGETTSLANGVWSATCKLHEPYNLSKHRIHAKVTTKLGVELTSETKECMYDMNAVQVSKVTMINVAHPANSLTPCEYVTVFDFLHPAKSIPDYWYWPDYPEFTFLIEFTDNDTTKVSNVVLWVETCNGNQVPLNAEYDENKGLWVASGNFGSWSNYDIPTNVSLDFDALSYGPISRQILDKASFDYVKHSESQKQIERQFAEFMAAWESGTLSEEDFEEQFSNLTLGGFSPDTSSIVENALDEVLLRAQHLCQESEKILSDSSSSWEDLSYMNIYNRFDLLEYGINGFLEIKPIDGLTKEALIRQGFEQIFVDDNSDVFQLVSTESYEIVDFNRNTHAILSFMSADSMMLVSKKSGLNIQTLENKINQFNSRFGDLMDIVGKINEGLQLIPGFFDIRLDKITYSIENNRNCYKSLQYFEGMALNPDDNLEISDQIKKLKRENIKLGKEKAKLLKNYEAVKGAIEKVTVIIGAFMDAYSMGSNANEYINLWYSVPYCDCDSVKTQNLKDDILGAGLRCVGKDLANIAGDIVTIHMIFGSITAAPATGGSSLVLGIAGISLSVVKGLVNGWSNMEFEKERALFTSRIRNLANDTSCYNCSPPPRPNNPDNPNPDDPKPNNPNPNNPYPHPYPNKPNKGGNNGGKHKSNNPNVGGVHDPSGYVYEGVSSNRVEGVMASCYYKETVEDIYGDQHENVVLWNAEEYAQENPLFTDANGMYRWDVPKGLWQVKFEKEGYETTYSEWLPVPPPQLEVNIPMVQNKQPEVADVHAYKDGVEIEFDKYMQPATLNTDNIFVTQNDEKVAGTVTLLNEEVAYEGQSETYASKVRFVFDQAVTAKEITLTVVNSVKSYAGLQMQDTYIQTLAIEQEVEGIVADSLVSMYYGGEQTLTVKVIPAAAAAGKTLVVTSSSPMILGVDTDSIVLDDSGEAVLTVSGELPGMGAISYSLVGYDYRASTLVEVVYNNTKMTANPTASIASGTTVAKGTEVTLSCTTEGAAIYYTLDGSCPCDDTAILYDGTPIVINENTELRIMAVAEGMYESDVVVYNYYVEGADVEEVTLPFGIDPTIVTDGFRVQGIEAECTVAVYGVGGELVLQREHVKNNTFVNIAHVPEGMYIVVVSKDDDTHKQRILKVK